MQEARGRLLVENKKLRKPLVFGRAEYHELQNLLRPGEHVIEAAFGFYQGGSGLIIATNHRIVLIDKRPFFLNTEEVRYEDLASISIARKLMHATIEVHGNTFLIQFSSLSDAVLRKIAEYAKSQERAVASESDYIEEQIDENVNRPMLRPFLDPRWRPHHTTILKRKRLAKFDQAPAESSLGRVGQMALVASKTKQLI